MIVKISGDEDIIPVSEWISFRLAVRTVATETNSYRVDRTSWNSFLLLKYHGDHPPILPPPQQQPLLYIEESGEITHRPHCLLETLAPAVVLGGGREQCQRGMQGSYTQRPLGNIPRRKPGSKCSGERIKKRAISGSGNLQPESHKQHDSGR